MQRRIRFAALTASVLLFSACGTTPPAFSLEPPLTASATLGTLTVGQTRQIRVTVNGQTAQPGQLTWTTTDAQVATVTQAGLVTAVKAGTATIRVAVTVQPSTFLDFTVTVAGATTTPTPTPAPTPTPTPAPTPTAPTSSFEQQVFDLTNQARATARTCGTQSFNASPPLAYNAALRQAAYDHSRDMALNGYFAHNSLDGRTPFQRMTAAGYTGYRTAGENIAGGQTTPQAVVDGWLKSPGHCANIMNPGFKELGVGYYAGGSYRHYWTQDFGAR